MEPSRNILKHAYSKLISGYEPGRFVSETSLAFVKHKTNRSLSLAGVSSLLGLLLCLLTMSHPLLCRCAL